MPDSRLDNVERAASVYRDRAIALALAVADIGRQNAIRRAQAKPPCCPACEVGDHECAATYHAVFACACACNRERQ